MRKIPLTQHKVALVDDADYGWLSQWKWFAQKDHARDKWYAVRTVNRGRGRSPARVFMHRAILGLAGSYPKVDHRDLDGLNNQRHNLRTASDEQNARNKPTVARSGFRGVYFLSDRSGLHVWQARVSHAGRDISLGCFDDPAEAARVYDAAARKYHGEFARTNF